MGLVTLEERLYVVELLSKLPNIERMEVRGLLLADLPLPVILLANLSQDGQGALLQHLPAFPRVSYGYLTASGQRQLEHKDGRQ